MKWLSWWPQGCLHHARMEHLLTNHSLPDSFLCSWTGTDRLHGVSWHAVAF